jgi:hypothetical protein
LQEFSHVSDGEEMTIVPLLFRRGIVLSFTANPIGRSDRKAYGRSTVLIFVRSY